MLDFKYTLCPTVTFRAAEGVLGTIMPDCLFLYLSTFQMFEMGKLMFVEKGHYNFVSKKCFN